MVKNSMAVPVWCDMALLTLKDTVVQDIGSFSLTISTHSARAVRLGGAMRWFYYVIRGVYF